MHYEMTGLEFACYIILKYRKKQEKSINTKSEKPVDGEELKEYGKKIKEKLKKFNRENL